MDNNKTENNKKLQEQLDELKDRFEEELKKSQKENEKLKADIKLLTERRINQSMIMPDVVKMRHLGEGTRFVRNGASTALPTTGESTLQGSACFFDETNNKWYIWNTTSETWKSVTLT